MKQLSYTISYLKNTWSSNLIKVLSLTLGLAIGLILFARIAFDLSYDRFLPGADHIYQVQTIYTTGVGTSEVNSLDYGNTFQPVAPTMPLEFPEQVSLHAFIFILAGISLLIVIGVCVVVRSWLVANENPVKGIKLE